MKFVSRTAANVLSLIHIIVTFFKIEEIRNYIHKILSVNRDLAKASQESQNKFENI